MATRNQVLQQLRNNQPVWVYDFVGAFPTDKEMEMIAKMFPDAEIQVPSECIRMTAVEKLLNGFARVPKKRNDGLKALPIVYETNEDGSITTYLPAGCPPDTAGFNLNRAKQSEKKSKIVARLREKNRATVTPS